MANLVLSRIAKDATSQPSPPHSVSFIHRSLMGSYPGVMIRYPESDDYQEDRIVAQVLKVLDYNGARINFFENKLDSESVEYLSWDELQQLGIDYHIN